MEFLIELIRSYYKDALILQKDCDGDWTSYDPTQGYTHYNVTEK